MNTRFISFIIAAGCVLSFTLCASAQQRPLKVSMYSGSEEYKSDQSLVELKQYLEQNFNVECTLNIVKNYDTLPGVDQLATCDVAVIYTRRVKATPAEVELIKKYCAAGKPIVGIRTASHAIQTWLAFDKEVLGGDYQGHYGVDRRAEITIPDSAKGHPVLTGVKPFITQGKLYKNPKLADDVQVLLRGATDQNAEPVAWVRKHNGGRVFYTSLGIPDDFKDDNFRRLIANAILWTAGRDPQPKP